MPHRERERVCERDREWKIKRMVMIESMEPFCQQLDTSIPLSRSMLPMIIIQTTDFVGTKMSLGQAFDRHNRIEQSTCLVKNVALPKSFECVHYKPRWFSSFCSKSRFCLFFLFSLCVLFLLHQHYAKSSFCMCFGCSAGFFPSSY